MQCIQSQEDDDEREKYKECSCLLFVASAELHHVQCTGPFSLLLLLVLASASECDDIFGVFFCSAVRYGPFCFSILFLFLCTALQYWVLSGASPPWLLRNAWKKKGSPLAMQCYRWSKERIIISLSFICLFYSQSFICSFSPRFPFALHHWLGTIRWGRYHFVGGTFAGRAHCWYQCDSALSRSGLLPLNGDDDDNHAQDQDRPRQGRRVPYQMATLCTSLYHHADSMLIPSNMYISTHLNFLKHLTYFLIK